MIFLRYTNRDAEKFFLCNLGGIWPDNPLRRLVERTSRDAKEAKPFESVDDARATLVTIGQGKGWEIIGEDGKVIE